MLRNDQDGLLGELIAQQLHPLAALYVRQGGTIQLGRSVREAIHAQGWTLDGGGKARVNAEWLATALKTLDDHRAQMGAYPTEQAKARAWTALARAVESQDRGQG